MSDSQEYTDFISENEFNYAKQYIKSKSNNIHKVVNYLFTRFIQKNAQWTISAETFLTAINYRIAQKIIINQKYHAHNIHTASDWYKARVAADDLTEIFNVLLDNPNFSRDCWSPDMEYLKEFMPAATKSTTYRSVGEFVGPADVTLSYHDIGISYKLIPKYIAQAHVTEHELKKVIKCNEEHLNEFIKAHNNRSLQIGWLHNPNITVESLNRLWPKSVESADLSLLLNVAHNRGLWDPHAYSRELNADRTARKQHIAGIMRDVCRGVFPFDRYIDYF